MRNTIILLCASLLVSIAGCRGCSNAPEKVPPPPGPETPTANEPPIAAFKHTPSGTKTHTLEFDATESKDPDGRMTKYEWEFGDGQTAEGIRVEHTYPDDDGYLVTLTVTDDRSASRSTSRLTTIETPGDNESARKFTEFWSSGSVSFSSENLEFTIAREYNQRVLIGVDNRGTEARSIAAEVGQLGGGLLGDFVGTGSQMQPLELAPRAEAHLSLYFFAQDSMERTYRSHVIIKDFKTREVLATAPLIIHVPLPEFSFHAKISAALPGTLARPVELENKGGPITDLSVEPGDGLKGRVYFQPSVDHAYLGIGGRLSFNVVPRLSTDFSKLNGEIVLRGAGQEQTFKVDFELPPGKRLFVASSFSTSCDEGGGRYCTNDPDTDTRIGGPSAPPEGSDDPSKNPNGPPEDEDLRRIDELLKRAKRALRKQNIPGTPIRMDGRIGGGVKAGPLEIKFDAGAAPGRDPRGPIADSNITVKVGPFKKTKHTDVSISPKVQEPHIRQHDTGTINVNSARQLDRAMSEIDGQGYQQRHRPRGLAVRKAYAMYRPRIYHDNHAESMYAFSEGAPNQRVILQVWHSNLLSAEPGRHVLFRVWDGHGQRPLTRLLLLSKEKTYNRWPAVLAIPGGRAMVVWETSDGPDTPPSLVYRVSGQGFGAWSPGLPVPGGQAKDGRGHFDPVAIRTPDHNVILVWQHGAGRDARIMMSRSNAQGLFSAPVSPGNLPSGASRPIVRVMPDGTLHVVFQVVSTDPSQREVSSVYHSVSRDGGASFETITCLSPAGTEAGEADLLLQGETVHVAFRAGTTWSSRIMYLVSTDSGKTWNEPQPVTPDTLYAEYPSLAPLHGGGVDLEFYGDERKNVNPKWGQREPDLKGFTVPAGSMLKRYGYNGTDGQWTAPRRRLTNFPAVQVAWLQVNFRLNTDRSSYRPHEITVLLNGHPLLHQTDAIPEGTYCLPFHPVILRFDRNGLPCNVVGLRTRHSNQAHYLTAAGFRLQARHRFLERFVVADSQQEADAMLAAETKSINHQRPDIGLFATFSNKPLPTSPETGQPIELQLLLGNLGESPAREVRVQVYESQPTPNSQPIAEVMRKERMEPLQFEEISVRFPYTGKGRYYVVARAEGTDFDPANNVHVASFVVPKPPAIPPTDIPSAPPELLANDVAPAWVAGSVPAGAKLIGDWNWHDRPAYLAPRSHAGPADEGPSLHYFIRAPRPLALDEGENLVQYVYLDPEKPPRQILLKLYVEGSQEEHRVYWGEDLITLPAIASASCRSRANGSVCAFPCGVSGSTGHG